MLVPSKIRSSFSPHLVSVNDGAAKARGTVGQHTGPELLFIDRVGRRRQVNDDIDPLLGQVSDGVAGVAAASPKFFVIPQIFANGDPKFLESLHR